MRTNIYNLLSNETMDIKKEYNRIYTLFEKTRLYLYKSLLEYIDETAFINWKYRGRFLDINEMMEYLKIDNVSIKSIYLNKKFNVEMLLRYVEFIINMINICHFDSLYMDDIETINTLKSNINSLLEDLNYEIFRNSNNQLIIKEKDAKATAVAEKFEDISDEIIEYRRYSLKGNIQVKREILLMLSDKIEPINKRMKSTSYATILNDITNLLNNLNIRHNNYSGPKKQEYLINMKDEELEKWYDITYDLMLTAFMLEDYLDNKDKLDELKKNLKKC